MKHLVKFSLCYDCTDSIVKLLVRNCKNTLRILDVEMSKQVGCGWLTAGHVIAMLASDWSR